jgi:hypothetical protein
LLGIRIQNLGYVMSCLSYIFCWIGLVVVYSIWKRQIDWKRLCNKY